MHRTCPFARRADGLYIHRTRDSFEGCAPHTVCSWFGDRAPHEQVVCAPHTAYALAVRWSNERMCSYRRFDDGTTMCGALTTCSLNERPCAVPKPLVRGTNAGVRCTTTCSSNEQRCAVTKQPVRRTNSGAQPTCSNGRVPSLNHMFVERTVVRGHQTTCSSHEQTAVHNPPVLQRVRRTNHRFFVGTDMCGAQTTGSSNERPCAVYKPLVRRTNGLTNHRFVVRTAVCGTQTTRTHIRAVIAPSVHPANSGVRASVTEPAVRAVAPAIF